MNIHQKALGCQNGVNPRAIARLLVEAVDAAVEEGRPATDDAAVYLVMDKLASLGLYPQSFENYGPHYDECRRRAASGSCPPTAAPAAGSACFVIMEGASNTPQM